MSLTSGKSVYILISVVGVFLIFAIYNNGSYTDISPGLEDLITRFRFRTNDTTEDHVTSLEGDSTQILPAILGKSVPTLNSITNRSLYSATKEVTPPAVLIRPKGGTGNQLFQYACHYAIARKHNWPLYIMYSTENQKLSKDRNFGVRKRDFALDQFNIPLYSWNTVDETWNLTGGLAVNDSTMLTGVYPGDKIIQQSGGDYCQSETFFAHYRDELLEYFRMKIGPENDPLVAKWAKKIDAIDESVAVHIRRGDFIRLNISLPLQFHRDSMSKIVERFAERKVAFFVFSDDMEYVKKNLFKENDDFQDKFEIFMVSEAEVTKSIQELYLMSRCNHQIIPSSSFSWWAAYLNRNPGKVVYAAHFRTSFIESIYPNLRQREFFLWAYRHIYYPTGWNAIDPDWDKEDL